jgi:CheY-like chemotaxis protein
VVVVSTEDAIDRAQSVGALSVVSKPIKTQETLEQLLETIKDFVRRPVKDLLVVGKDPVRRNRILEFLGTDDVRVTEASSGKDALEVLGLRHMDCTVLDPELPDMTAEAFVEGIRRENDPVTLPVIVYSDERTSNDDKADPKNLAPTVTLKRVCSPERLLDQTAFYLHSPVAKLPEPKKLLLERLYQTDHVLAGKKVLIVDDDIRNIFALTSVLEWRNMVIRSAETGRDAIKILQAEPDVDIVLMDIMMPEMDGIDTMRAIRKLPEFKSLPIIAVTAKAMKGDREKCIEAGAWDYLSKPVDTEQMLSVLRAWLHR